jgi:hypothetical protein
LSIMCNRKMTQTCLFEQFFVIMMLLIIRHTYSIYIHFQCFQSSLPATDRQTCSWSACYHSVTNIKSYSLINTGLYNANLQDRWFTIHIISYHIISHHITSFIFILWIHTWLQNPYGYGNSQTCLIHLTVLYKTYLLNFSEKKERERERKKEKKEKRKKLVFLYSSCWTLFLALAWFKPYPANVENMVSS